jgi:hypothetical protein
MPRSPSYGAGNVNMKGKKYKLRHCGCCWCIDFRDRELKKEHQKEMKDHDVFTRAAACGEEVLRLRY